MAWIELRTEGMDQAFVDGSVQNPVNTYAEALAIAGNLTRNENMKITHNTIILTSDNQDHLIAALKYAAVVGLRAMGPSGPPGDSYKTLVICPDDRKTANRHDDLWRVKRAMFQIWLETRVAFCGWQVDWVAVEYGEGAEGAHVVESSDGEEDAVAGMRTPGTCDEETDVR